MREVPRYPTALLAAALALAVTLISLAYTRIQRRAGEVALLCVVLYAPGRFVIEGLRADPRGGAGGLSTSQWLAVAFGLPALAGWAWLRFGPAPPSPDDAPPSA